jgi:hypothetical protein
MGLKHIRPTFMLMLVKLIVYNVSPISREVFIEFVTERYYRMMQIKLRHSVHGSDDLQLLRI